MRRRNRNGFKNRRHASHCGPMCLLMVGWTDVYQHHSAGGWGMGHTLLHKASLQNPHADFFFSGQFHLFYKDMNGAIRMEEPIKPNLYQGLPRTHV